MIENSVLQGLFEPTWCQYRNAHFIVPKKNGKSRCIISTLSADRNTLDDARRPPNVKGFSEAFAGLLISSIIDIHSEYNQPVLLEDS